MQQQQQKSLFLGSFSQASLISQTSASPETDKISRELNGLCCEHNHLDETRQCRPGTKLQFLLLVVGVHISDRTSDMSCTVQKVF